MTQIYPVKYATVESAQTAAAILNSLLLDPLIAEYPKSTLLTWTATYVDTDQWEYWRAVREARLAGAKF